MENITSSVVFVSTSSMENFTSNMTPTASMNGSIDLCSTQVIRSESNRAVQISAQVVIAFLMFGLGCTTEIKLMWNYLKAPKQIFTGLILQLVLLPFLGFTLSYVFVMSEAETMGAIITSSCPGGVYSNIASYWLDGDMDLSIVLTSLSTLLAMGTLPLWLFVFPEIKQIENKCLKIPFDNLGYTLLGIVSPVIVGMLVKWKFPKASIIISKICSIVGSLAVLAIVILLSVTQGPYFAASAYWKTLLFSVVFPSTAVLFGYLATRVPWLTFSVAARRTIAIETAMQNAALSVTIVLVSYNIFSSYFGPVVIIPFLYGLFQLGATLIAVIIYLVAKRNGRCKWLYTEDPADK